MEIVAIISWLNMISSLAGFGLGFLAGYIYAKHKFNQSRRGDDKT